LSTESILSPPSPVAAGESCVACDAPLAGDQRYCLECGERRTAVGGVPHGRAPLAVSASPEALGAVPSTPPSHPPNLRPPDVPRTAAGDAGRGNAVTVIAGVGVLLLAMGVGVLIGRSGGSSKPAAAAAPQVISVASAPAATAGSTPSSEAATFSDDWPTATNGYTVELQSLPQAGTQVSAVEAAKTAAGAKGAKQVGALKSEDFGSLKAGSYIVYSGVFHKRAEAVKAQAGLKKSFPGAAVIKVSSATSGASAAGSAAGSKSGAAAGAGSSESHPAPPSVVEGLSKTKGKSYEEKSKSLPDVISTG
jgi:hypothetical protein